MKQLGLSVGFDVQRYSNKNKRSGFSEDAEEGGAKLEWWHISELLLPSLWARHLAVTFCGIAVHPPLNNTEEKWPCEHFTQLEIINVLDRVISWFISYMSLVAL